MSECPAGSRQMLHGKDGIGLANETGRREPVRVMVWGLGAMGAGIARLITHKPGMILVGGTDRDETKIGRDLGEVCGGRSLGIVVEDDAAAAMIRCRPDLVVLATDSFLATVVPQVEAAVDAGCDVICLAEEMAYPWVVDAASAAKMDVRARRQGVTVLGTGINPGFVLDTLVIALTGVCHDVRRIRAARINDLSPYGPTVMRTQGVGVTPDEFTAGISAGTIVGHVGFQQSAAMIAAALGWDLDRVEESREPIVAQVRRRARFVTVEPGRVAGCRHTARGYRGGELVLELEHPQQVLPGAEGIETGDYIHIEGMPALDLCIKPEIPGGLGTTALAVNMIPKVRTAKAGLLTMKDLPVPAAVLGEAGRGFSGEGVGV